MNKRGIKKLRCSFLYKIVYFIFFVNLDWLNENKLLKVIHCFYISVDKSALRLCRWIAWIISIVINSIIVIPAASHIFGYILISVKPGNVFISFSTNLFSDERRKSTRAIPSQQITLQALTAKCRIFRIYLLLSLQGFAIQLRLNGYILRRRNKSLCSYNLTNDRGLRFFIA